jgi:tetratricopeptide (TPR) repeat protein
LLSFLIAIFVHISSIDAVLSDSQMSRVDSLTAEGDLAGVAAILRQVYSEDESDVGTLKLLADVCARMGDLASAEQALTIVIERDQFDADAYLELGRFAWLRREFDVSLQYIDLAERVSVRPNPKVPAYKSVVFRAVGKLAEAESLLVTALGTFPNSPIVLSNLGLAVALQRGPAEGFRYAYLAYDLDTTDVYSLSSLASLHLAAGNLDSARICYEMALAADPGNYFVKSGLENLETTAAEMRIPMLMQEGVRYFDRALYLRARKAFREVVALDSTFFEAWLNLGFTLNLLGEPRNAVSVFEKAVTLDSMSAPLYIGWGNALAGINEFDSAIEKYEQARLLDSAIVEVEEALKAVKEMKRLSGEGTQ